MATINEVRLRTIDEQTTSLGTFGVLKFYAPLQHADKRFCSLPMVDASGVQASISDSSNNRRSFHCRLVNLAMPSKRREPVFNGEANPRLPSTVDFAHHCREPTHMLNLLSAAASHLHW